MKRLGIFTLILALYSSVSFAQEGAGGHTPCEFVRTLDLDSTMSVRDIHAAAKRWMADAFRNSESIIRIDDADAGELMGKSAFPFKTSILIESAVRHGVVRFSLEILSKPGRCRFRMYDFIHEGTMGRLSSGQSVMGSNLGPIYCSAMPCFPQHKNGKVSGHTTNVCEKEVWPQVKLHEEGLWTSFRLAMTGSSKVKDW